MKQNAMKTSIARDAVLKCFGQTRDDMKNIDEVFIEFCENDFERVYAR